jgi:hypothetical protein
LFLVSSYLLPFALRRIGARAALQL